MAFSIGDTASSSAGAQVNDAGVLARLQLVSSTRVCTEKNHRSVSGLVSPLPHHLAHRLLEYISENIETRLKITELAAAVTLSRSHFSRLFVMTFGMTPHRFIMKSRVEVAQVLLENTNHALSDIAVECGFADQAHFSRVFVKNRGIAPGMWRTNYQDRSTVSASKAIDD